MDKIIFEGIDKFGFPVMVSIVMAYGLYKSLRYQIKEQEERICKLESSHEKDREAFIKSTESFNNAVVEFQNVNKEIKTIKDDISEIKAVVNIKNT